MSSAALNQIANALQNGIGLSISTSGYTWDNPPPIGFGGPNTALFTNLSTTTFTASSFTATGGLNNTPIGQQTSNLGNFTILTASTITGPIGQVTSNAGSFTQLQASSISGRANTFFTSSLIANAIDSATIGLTTSNIGYFTLLQASTLTGPIGLTTSNAGNFTELQASSISGRANTFFTSSLIANAIDSATIGLTTSNAGNFTLLQASTLTGPIGLTTSNAGNFTELQASSISGRANTFFTSSLTANAIDSATIGLTTSNTGNFTQLQASSIFAPNTTFSTFTASTITGAVGRVTSNAGNFTQLQASTIFAPFTTTSSLTVSTLTGPVGQVTSNVGNFTQLQASSIFSPNTTTSTLTASTITLANSLLTTTSSITVSGLFSNTGITAVQEIIETLNLKSTTSGVVTHDWLEGAIWYHSSMTANFSCSIINLPIIPNRSLVATLILNQGATPYYASTLLLNGSRTPIRWVSATAPVPVANRTEIESFTLFYIGTTWTALGQYTSFGTV